MKRIKGSKRIYIDQTNEKMLLNVYQYARGVAFNLVRHYDTLHYHDIATAAFTTLLEVLNKKSPRQIERKKGTEQDLKNWIAQETIAEFRRQRLHYEREGHEYPPSEFE